MPSPVRLPRDHAAPALARRAVRERFADLGEATVDRLTLAVSELVTNAVRHGEGAIVLTLDRGADRVRVEVVDEGSGAVPEIRDAAQEDDRPGGHGLRIVEAVSDRWGAFEGTTHVWAEFTLG